MRNQLDIKYFFKFYLEQRPQAGQDILIREVSRAHSRAPLDE